jgi:hypothetical protein
VQDHQLATHEPKWSQYAAILLRLDEMPLDFMSH